MSQPGAGVHRIGNRLTLIGTVHVDPASVSLVGETIEALRPEVVALELDQARFYALQNPKRARITGSVGPSFLAMVLLERFAGQMTGSPPGMEMVQAIRTAKSVGARVELVDLPIEMTVSGLRSLPLKEKLRIAVDSVMSLVVLPFGKLDLSSIAAGVGSQLLLFRHRYPQMSRLLLDDREHHIANRIRSILKTTTGHVVAIIGLGHIEALSQALAGYDEKPAFSTTLTWSLSTL